MRALDWIVLGASLVFIAVYGVYKGRGSNTVNKYLLAGKTMPWWAVALSIMATQASAITFISTTGQSYVDGMRFVQFYFGLPVAMVILAATAVPAFHRTNVYTAYEYLEKRFDAKTRALVTVIFLIQRGLGAGFTIYAPAIVLTVLLGWPDQITTLVMGGIVILYTVLGGIKAVTWTDVQQMAIVMGGLLVALVTAIRLLPPEVSLLDAVSLAGAAGKLNAVDLSFDLQNRYNIWSGLIGGTFLALAYFGTDQSQVQRYLSGKSITHSRISLLFNGIAKIPMQFIILFTGAMVFVFYIYQQPPLLFQPVELNNIQALEEYGPLAERYRQAFEERKAAATELIQARRSGDRAYEQESLERYRQAHSKLNEARAEGAELVKKASGSSGFNDTNYIFLSFVTKYMPAGLVGLVMAMIFAAAMSSTSAEINSLATVTVIDLYKRHIRREGSDRHYLWVSRLATAFWGVYAVLFAQFVKSMGSLVEAVNVVGSLFYGGMLGVFVLAFYFPRVRGNAAFIGVLAGEAAIFYSHWFTQISFLWYNVIGCAIVVGTGLLISRFERRPAVL
ncbi:MAG TPA: sodium:solute symporter [Bryobacteraceae bacterium]|nr:sodium:solute symporter [Bryobacteraceae bacterium]HOL72321.1 sodium:solute symporter [Bryobacteraceae bacterium]HOQ44725.1 sodium:solute symporter [Bryobacteraceae bacterium]HPQ17076.1 sodium:solute symporter [Bryobacteraceae bacterium]HPU71935.1 sodium:solute symporter [Bryobacteraceae bacterium]